MREVPHLIHPTQYTGPYPTRFRRAPIFRLAANLDQCAQVIGAGAMWGVS